ncbi:MAG: nuclear transport factor 2 family protein [Thermoanaerobaculia bacterium]
MTRDHELWELEREFWLGGVEFYERTLAPHALMVFPPPAGVLDRATTIDSIRSVPRWRSVSFDEQHLVPATEGTAVLVYSAHAERGSPDSRYAAQCSSVYVRGDRGWLLLLHQQTPVG